MTEKNTKKTSEEFFVKLNKELGGALESLPEQPHEVVGRVTEMHDLELLLERPRTPIALILGEAGTGKTALVESYMKKMRKQGKKIYLFSLSIGALASDGLELLQKRMEQLMPNLKSYQDALRQEEPGAEVVLFIDEVHTVISIFGKGSKVGGDLLKRSLARKYVKVITATTRVEYDTYIATDEPLDRRFKPLELNEVNFEQTVLILRNWLDTYADTASDVAEKISSQVSDELLSEVVRANKLYREHLAEPAKSIDILESMIAKHKVDKVPFDHSMVADIFSHQYNINLDTIANIENIENELVNSIIGQPLAVYNVTMMIRRMIAGIDRLKNKNQAKATMLYTGSTGVGKTEMAKAIARSLYNDESKLFIINMPDFKTIESEALFRRKLGNHIKHDPSAIVLFDEFEKAGTDTLDAMLSILDEGRVSFTEKSWDDRVIYETVSLRNAIIIATTNAGANMFDDTNRYGQISKISNQENLNEYTDDLRREWKKKSNEINQALIGEKIKPEILGRFNRIIPFLPLSEATMLEIAHKELMKTKKILEQGLGITLRTKPKEEWHYGTNFYADELSMFLVFDNASQEDSKSGGARAIKNLVETEFEEAVITALIEYPDVKSFDVTLNDKAGFLRDSNTTGEGEIVVKPSLDINSKKFTPLGKQATVQSDSVPDFASWKLGV